MTSQSSASSLAKHRQSWLDLVSQASPVAGETVVCSVQVHTHRPPPQERAEEDEEEEETLHLHQEAMAPQDPPEMAASEEHPVPGGQTLVAMPRSEEDGKTVLKEQHLFCPQLFFIDFPERWM